MKILAKDVRPGDRYKDPLFGNVRVVTRVDRESHRVVIHDDDGSLSAVLEHEMDVVRPSKMREDKPLWRVLCDAPGEALAKTRREALNYVRAGFVTVQGLVADDGDQKIAMNVGTVIRFKSKHKEKCWRV